MKTTLVIKPVREDAEPLSKDDLNALLEERLQAYSEWLDRKQKGGPLSRMEKAMVKTYLIFELQAVAASEGTNEPQRA